jgi:hypothetical protein
MTVFVIGQKLYHQETTARNATEPQVSYSVKAPKARYGTAWANGPGKKPFSFQALKARDKSRRLSISRFQRSAIHICRTWRIAPGYYMTRLWRFHLPI